MPAANVPKGARIVEFDPKKFYIVIFDRQHITQEDRAYLQSYLNDQGVKGVSIIIHGNPMSVNIIDKKKQSHA